MTVLPLLLLVLGQSGYAGSPPVCIRAALDAAEVTASDVVYDIGSGDGRVVAIASKLYGARAVGIERAADELDQLLLVLGAEVL